MMIRSLIENDVYKWNISYFYMMTYPFAEIEFEFVDRKKEEFDQDFVDEFKREFAALSGLTIKPGEKEFLISNFRWIPKYFFDWFCSSFRYRPDIIKAWLDEDHHFHVTFQGLAYEVTFYEMPVLVIFTGLRARYKGYDKQLNMKDVIDRAREQIDLSNAKGLSFSEFGLRRRFSGVVQDTVDDWIKKEAKYCVGNSNVYEAFRLDQKISGTIAHECSMVTNAFKGYRLGNYFLVEDWMKVFKGEVGIMLPDTIGIDAFLNNMSMLQAKAMDGVRHDSGRWETFTTKFIERWKELKVDPLSKTIVYSDGLDMFKFEDIYNNVRGRVGKVGSGIGGAFTNNTGIEGAKVECVCKARKVRINKTSSWINCVKCPDTDGKFMGDPSEVELCLKTVGR